MNKKIIPKLFKVSKIIFIICLSFYFFSCGESKSNYEKSKLKNLISVEKMIDILVDVQIVEAALVKKRGKNEDTDFYSQYYYKKIFTKYSISKDQYDFSLEYYKNNIEIFEKIYQQVSDSLLIIKKEILDKKDTLVVSEKKKSEV
ncbi:MAG: DUF4296 domain-containing protein [Bacteroidales bacterium]|nr:DUF4296 domain-containing protein [Bacteroidales bacterium]